ncbi:Ferrichrome-iron receptor precursor [Rhodobacteraceae bacterium THAF1]|uniref:TonB-dependent siderophore receptor n=1 Tax=Palleronia sp. THAF1 TaxID=2587842 RepID=UPI000F403863|nr:TonB-dependent siderophore receptor [Palleronia sp. THAF1]QFU08756.1 Ferrichrome-iron receptor precursor [Palleronia sp. THAF1]VDC31259.1 Ferrichrome-iron receptor precursor [Rhodobacteraceae bacterium THAF1]
MKYPSTSTRSAIAALLCCTSLVPGQTAAQDAVQLPDIILDSGAVADDQTIVAEAISAGGKLTGDILDIPASVSVVTSAEIERRNAKDIEEVLNYTAGVVTNSYGADDRFDYFSIRGFNAYTYRDGLTLGENFGGIREEPFAFERVEVFKGANSAVFGVSDPGGSVNYVTKTPRGARFGSAYGTIGSFDTKEVGLDFGDVLNADGSLSYRFTGLVRDGEREYPFSRNDEVFVMGGLSWQPTERTELTFVLDHLDRDDVPGSGGFPIGYDFDRSDTFFGEPDFNFRGTERTTATLIGRHDFGNGLSFGGTARFSDGNDDFGYAYVSGQTATDANRSFFASDSAEKVAIADVHLAYDPQFGSFASSTLLGFEASRSESSNKRYFGPAPSVSIDDPVYTGAPSSVPLFADGETEVSGRAVYLQETLDWNDRVIASFGVRQDWIDITERDLLAGSSATNDISATTGRFGLTYKATTDLSLFASYAQSVVPAGTGVEPENGEQFEIGAKWRPLGGGTLLSAAAYDLSKTNITRTNPVTNLPEPIGEIRVRGIDLEAKAELGAFDLTASYSYIDPEITENGTAGNEGNQPARVPNHIGSIWANYTLEGDGARGDMTFGLGARYSGSYFFDDANVAGESDSYVAIDAAYTYALSDNTELAINATNLFDEKHVAFGGFYADFYSPGREVQATIRRSW